jgi:hypothetical protein
MQYSLVSPSASSVVVSSKEEEKKKRRESGDSFVNVCLRLQLTCLLLSAICCFRLCFFRVLLDARPFCFLQYTALPTFCNCRLFFYIVHVGSGPPHSLVEVSTWQPLLQACPFSKHTGGRWRHSCLLQPTRLFTVRMRDCPSPTLWGSGYQRVPRGYESFFLFSCLCIIQFLFFSFFFPLGGGQSVQGLCWSGPGLSVGVLHAA